MSKRLLFLLLLMGVCLTGSHSLARPKQNQASDELPPSIQAFQDEIQTMTQKQIDLDVIKRFGKPARDVGSGLTILEWYVGRGVLTVTMEFGLPTFKTASGKTVWLLRTKNPAGVAIRQDWEIDTLPDPNNHGTSGLLGNIHFTGNEYQFTASYADISDRRFAGFFLRNPAGTINIQWAPGITMTSVLEDAGNRVIALVTFQSKKRNARLRCPVKSSVDARALTMTSKTFRMGVNWPYYFPNQKTPNLSSIAPPISWRDAAPRLSG